MIHFRNDYNDLAHPDILEFMMKHTHEAHLGYGMDEHVKKAKANIEKHLKEPVFMHFMSGGTSTNKIVISHLLKPYEAVISASTGHIEVHETGAIESTGHKIISVPTTDGKLTPELIEKAYQGFTDEHMVKPKMVYISNATETGFVYDKQELKDIYDLCQKLHLYLFVDGARLGVALTSKNQDLTLQDMVTYTDIFYIGGTKNGALLGEVVITKHVAFDSYFRYSMKQSGGLLAKGFLIGMQFEKLFEDQLFFDIARHANNMATYLISKLKELNIPFSQTTTNQQFIELPTHLVDKLSQSYTFEIWQDKGTSKVIRLVTNYRTTKSDIDSLIADIKKS
jgi:threonine aldolase